MSVNEWEMVNEGSRDCMILRGPSFTGRRTFVEKEHYDKAIEALKKIAIEGSIKDEPIEQYVYRLRLAAELTLDMLGEL